MAASFVDEIKLNQVFHVNGRNFGVAEVGDPTGEVVLDFYPLGSSRYYIAIETPPPGLRLICVDRPGSGLSSCLEDEIANSYTPVDFAKDINLILKEMNIESVHLVGCSAGAVYACAFAATFPSIVKSVNLISPWVSLSISTTTALYMAKNFVPIFLIGWTSVLMHTLLLSSFNSSVASTLTTSEAKSIDVTRIDQFKIVCEENTRRSHIGNARDMNICLGNLPWGYEYTQVVSHVDVVQGKADPTVSADAIKALQTALPSCTVTWIDGSHNGVILFQKSSVLLMISSKIH